MGPVAPRPGPVRKAGASPVCDLAVWAVGALYARAGAHGLASVCRHQTTTCQRHCFRIGMCRVPVPVGRGLPRPVALVRDELKVDGDKLVTEPRDESTYELLHKKEWIRAFRLYLSVQDIVGTGDLNISSVPVYVLKARFGPICPLPSLCLMGDLIPQQLVRVPPPSWHDLNRDHSLTPCY